MYVKGIKMTDISKKGKIKCAAEWCEELGIKSSTFFQRLKNGLNPFTGERV